ncbi:hypothetical protein DLM75_11850 [Leptospira stimsonii]|uniref:Uncharacterized protein n=1 Tax=Leptospira stimsonii TaxID=2202203 RepID=A0A396Z7S4_9LEPT|nr:hypothetical protein DLM75_11850 [Leptospira stimsonii]
MHKREKIQKNVCEKFGVLRYPRELYSSNLVVASTLGNLKPIYKNSTIKIELTQSKRIYRISYRLTQT